MKNSTDRSFHQEYSDFFLWAISVKYLQGISLYATCIIGVNNSFMFPLRPGFKLVIKSIRGKDKIFVQVDEKTFLTVDSYMLTFSQKNTITSELMKDSVWKDIFTSMIGSFRQPNFVNDIINLTQKYPKIFWNRGEKEILEKRIEIMRVIQ